jgi:hypothetical protein
MTDTVTIFGKGVVLDALAQQMGRALGRRDDQIIGYTADGDPEALPDDVLRAAAEAYVPPPAPPDPKAMLARLKAATSLDELRDAVVALEEAAVGA